MYLSGPAALADLLGDFVAYRSLRPVDARVQYTPPTILPRKIDGAYAPLVVDLLRAARAVEDDGAISQVIIIGDSVASDGALYTHLRPMLDSVHGVIVDESGMGREVNETETGLALATRWELLPRWAANLRARGLVVDSHTAILLDIDKTLLGARGRNAGVIDLARKAAMQGTIREVSGAVWDQSKFAEAHSTFNHARFHPFTGDNQDYVAVLCLIAAHNLIPAVTLARKIEAGVVPDLRCVLDNVLDMPSVVGQVREILLKIARRVRAGDPTPFKEFREREYTETIARMHLPADLAMNERLQTELCITGEVWSLAQEWRRQGALLFAVSDKPDEAALPTPALSAQGYLPLHRTQTHVVSEQ